MFDVDLDQPTCQLLHHVSWSPDNIELSTVKEVSPPQPERTRKRLDCVPITLNKDDNPKEEPDWNVTSCILLGDYRLVL